MKIEGSVALVTGANRGIGAAIVAALLDAGVSRVYAGMRTPTPSASPKVIPFPLDITNAEQIAQAARDAGDVRILVNNAGISTGQPLLATNDPDAAQREMNVNYFGTLNTIRAFAPILARNGGGAIVNVLSILSRVNAPVVGSYGASKAAAFALTQAVRAELARQGTLVVGLLPGFVDTDMTAKITLPKLAASDVAGALVEALRRGTEDVYPGDASAIEAGLRLDPKAVERQFAELQPRG